MLDEALERRVNFIGHIIEGKVLSKRRRKRLKKSYLDDNNVC